MFPVHVSLLGLTFTLVFVFFLFPIYRTYAPAQQTTTTLNTDMVASAICPVFRLLYF